MSVKQQSVSMPMSGAGIIGFSSDLQLSGLQIDPKALVIASFLIVVIVKAADFLVR